MGASFVVVIYAFQTRLMAKARKTDVFLPLYRWYREPVTVETLAIMRGTGFSPLSIDQTTQRWHNISMVMGNLELIAILVDARLVDEELVRAILGSVPVEAMHKMYPYYEQQLTEYPRYAYHLVRMVHRWERRPDSGESGYGPTTALGFFPPKAVK